MIGSRSMALALLQAAAALAAPAGKPPRAIVLMLGDDYGFGNDGFAHGPSLGNPKSRTPHMDRLARGGVVLDRHYVFKYCSSTWASGWVRLPFAVGCFSLLSSSSPPPATHHAAHLHRLGHFGRAQIRSGSATPNRFV